ncbi:MAG: glycosyltransferase family 4 protein [Patescibacteria group bacterium]
MPKIILFTTDFLPNQGGVANYYAGLLKQLPDFQVITHLVGSDRVAGVTRLPLFWSFWPYWLPMIWQMFKMGRLYPQAILAAGQILPVGTAMYIWHLFTKRPYFVFLHGFDVGLILAGGWFKKWLSGQILKSAKFLIVNSQYTNDLVKKISPRLSKILIIYPCPDLTFFNQAVSGDILSKYNLADKRVILSVGRLVARKGLLVTLEKLTPWLKQDKDLVYVIIGDGPIKKNLQAKIKADNLPVILTGNVSDQEKWAWYKKAEIFVMMPLAGSIDVEGFGIVYLEAQAAGCLVVGNYQGGVPEAIGEAGLILSDNQDLALICQQLLADKNKLEQLKQFGHKRLEETFNWPKQADKLKIFLENNLCQ